MSPSANTSGWPGSVRSGSTVTRPARSISAPLSLARASPASAEASRRRPRSPSARRIRSAGPPAVLDRHAAARRRRRPSCPSSGVTPSRSQRPLRPSLRARAGKLVSTSIRASTSSTRCRAGRPRGSRAERVAGELADLAGHLDAGGAGADDDERQPARSACGSGSTSAASKRSRIRLRTSSALSSDLTSARTAPTRRGRSRSTASRRRRSGCRRGSRRARVRHPLVESQLRASRSKSRTSASST